MNKTEDFSGLVTTYERNHGQVWGARQLEMWTIENAEDLVPKMDGAQFLDPPKYPGVPQLIIIWRRSDAIFLLTQMILGYRWLGLIPTLLV